MRVQSELFKTFIFTVVVPGTVIVLVPCFLLSSNFPSTIAPIQYAGVLVIMMGSAIYFRCAWDFAAHGRGTPAPIDPPKELVVRGLYRFVRNPMYVGVLSMLAGEVLFFESPRLLVYAAVVSAMFHFFILFYEEPALKSRFGESYDRYCSLVPRWFPRFKNNC